MMPARPLSTLGFLLFAAGITACDDGTPDGGEPSSDGGDAADDASGAPDDADASPDTAGPGAAIAVERYTGVVEGRRDGLATGDFFTPAVTYGAIAVPREFEHVVGFQMTPMAPPVRSGRPSSGPLVLFTDTYETIVFSPLDHFFESLVWFEDGTLGYGLEGEIDEVPEGFEHRFILVRGQGIGATIAAWGDVLRETHGRSRTDRYADPGLTSLGYWTDNGAYYYYRTEEGMNEADTMLAVVRDARERGIPLGYLQLDSWWYFKEEGFPPGGLVDWSPQPAMFPDGLEVFSAELGLPLLVHNRWFAPDNVYRERYPFFDDEEMSFPLDGAIFGELMDAALAWGVFTYEQDWLMPQFWGVRHLREGVGNATAWMQAIDDAARARALTVQITMPGAAHIMDAVRRPSVTTVRSSIDYRAGISKESFWPQFHTVNLIAWAVGVLPFKDNFHASEAHGEAEALVSALSAGMVGLGDRIGDADPELVLRTCRADGVLLKPDAPAFPIDAMFLPHERPYTTATTTDIDGVGRWTYVAAYHLASAHPDRDFNDTFLANLEYPDPLEDIFVYPAQVADWEVDLRADLGIEGEVVAYDWRAGNVTPAGETFVLPADETHYGFAYVVFAPVSDNGIALVGETARYVTMADRRWASVSAHDDGFSFVVEGAPGEDVTILAWDAESSSELRTTVTIAADGAAHGFVGRN